MKKILCIVLIITMCSLCGCGSKEENQVDKQVVKVTTSEADKEVSRDETTTNEETTEEIQTSVEIETTIEEKNTTTSETTTTEVVTTQAPTTTPAPTTTESPTTTQTATTEPITTTQATTTSSNVNVNGAFKSFSVATLDGQTITQETFSKADVNVVIIWTTWCGYCKLEMPALQKVMEKYNGQSVQFFSIAADYGLGADEESVKYWIDQMQVTYPCMLYNDSLSDGYMENIEGYPTTLYLNKNGEIMMEFPGAYAAYGEDYAIDAHSYYLDFCLANPNYLPEE